MRDSREETGQLWPEADARSRRFCAQVDLCRRTLSSGDALRLAVRGTSMLPALWPGESVVVQNTSIEALEVGDVAVFARHDHFVVHRIVGRIIDPAGVTLVTRGDAQLHMDAPLRAAELLGTVTGVHRFGVDRPMPRRPAAAARAVAWIATRSIRVRSFLDRVNSVLVNRTIAAPTVRAGTGAS